MTKVRIITGLILGLSVGAFIGWAPLPLFNAVLLIVLSLAAYEFFCITLPHPSLGFFWAMLLTILLSILFLFFPAPPMLPLFAGVLLLCLSFYLFQKQDPALAVKQASLTLLGVFYISILFSHVGLIRALPQGVMWVYVLLASTFLADSGAYLVGHMIGRHKLAPRISPGKTVEGLVGGVFFSLIATLIVKIFFWRYLSLWDCLIVGCISGLVGPLGDLSESLIKRSVNLKDSGRLIPGHGGVLDRVDALLFTAPVVYYYAKYLKGF
ncbi:MAG: phosphatidate cytidylyltransferase [Deltaproteobacteria bacterium]|nr:phosphatidate cytidylyltransferase [Deltaproteobacteria bacterium]